MVAAVLDRQPRRLWVTVQTIFLREAAQRAECERILTAHYGADLPVTNFVLQPPCCGAALALEAWAIGGPGVGIERFDPHTVAVSYDGIRWIYCVGIEPSPTVTHAYEQTTEVLGRMGTILARAGARFDQVVRTWFYLGGITGREAGLQRYREMNRARSEFYAEIRFGHRLLEKDRSAGVYPASTGIGIEGRGLVGSCLALQTDRRDAFLIHLENPRQTPAYAYHRKYSPKSPKFSRAIALVVGSYVTTWVSGTASIVDSESQHRGDIEKQTEQTIGNIERLISRRNFSAHGVTGAGVGLADLAKIRVYVKRPQDFAACRRICEQRFGPVPAVYAVADVCRSELLVEIEGVAFSRYRGVQAV